MELHELDKESVPYKFSDLPVQKSADGFIRSIDAATRRSFYGTKKPTAEGDEDPTLFEIDHKTGNSAIDNTVCLVGACMAFGLVSASPLGLHAAAGGSVSADVIQTLA